MTEREREVLTLLVDGNSNSEIATRLSISLQLRSSSTWQIFTQNWV